jgi:hypothetical protein
MYNIGTGAATSATASAAAAAAGATAGARLTRCESAPVNSVTATGNRYAIHKKCHKSIKSGK